MKALIGPMLVWAFLLAMAGCARPGEEQCKTACLHYSKLFHDDKWADKLDKAGSEGERKTLEQQKAAEWEDIKTNPERGIHACIAACDRIGRQGAVDCILAAKTFAEAKKCNE